MAKNEEEVVLSFKLPASIVARIDRIIEVINGQLTGARANRRTIIEAALRGATLDDLEKKYGVKKR